jgi:hypothetical protein
MIIHDYPLGVQASGGWHVGCHGLPWDAMGCVTESMPR